MSVKTEPEGEAEFIADSIILFKMITFRLLFSLKSNVTLRAYVQH